MKRTLNKLAAAFAASMIAAGSLLPHAATAQQLPGSQAPLVSGSITAQNANPTGVATPGSAVEVIVVDKGALKVQVTGTYTAVGGLAAYGTINSVDWVSIPFTGPSSGATGIYALDATGYTRVRITATGAVTGQASVVIRSTPLTPSASVSITGGGDASAANQTAQITAEQATASGVGAPSDAASLTGSANAKLRQIGANQTNGTQQTRVLDGSGNAITSTSNALDVNIKGGFTDTGVGQGSTTSGQNGGLTQGAAKSTAPTYVDGTTNPLSITTAGALRVDNSANTQPTSAADGSNVATGSTTDAAAAAGGTGTVSAKLRTVTSQLSTLNANVVSTNSQLPTALGTTGNAGSLSVTRATSDASPIAPGTATATRGVIAAGTYNSTPPTFTNGQQGGIQLTSNGSLKVDNSANTQPVSAASLPLPSGAATAANQTGGGQKTQIVDGSGNVIGSTSNALNVAVVSGGGGGASGYAQGTTTSGQSGGLTQAAVNNAAPTYSDGTTNPLSMTAGGALRTADSAVLAAIGSTNSQLPAALGTTGNAGSLSVTRATSDAAPVAPGAATATRSVIAGGTYNSSAPTFANGQQGGLQLDSSGNLKINIAAGSSSSSVAQGSSTSGQTGPLHQGAVTAAAPTYSDGTTNPVSLTTAGAVRVDGSGATQPVVAQDSLQFGPTTVTAAGTTATVSFTNGSANIGWTSHNFQVGQAVYFTNSGGALPTGFSGGGAAANNYYVKTVVDANTFTVAASPLASAPAIVAGSAGSGTQTGNQVVTFGGAQNMTGYNSVVFQFTTFSSSNTQVTSECSEDAQNWTVCTGAAINSTQSSSPQSISTGVGATFFSRKGKWFRERLSTFQAGSTTTGLGTLSSASVVPTVAIGTITVSASNTAGIAAEGAAVSGNPVAVGLEGRTTDKTAVTSGQVVRPVATTTGKLVTVPYSVPELTWSYAAGSGGITNTTAAVTMAAAAGAGLRNYVTGCQLSADALGAATEVAVRDGASGTVLWRTKVGTSGMSPVGFQFPSPLRGTANTLLEAATLTASVTGSVYINCQGYTAP